jgi:hypothetical protein
MGCSQIETDKGRVQNSKIDLKYEKTDIVKIDNDVLILYLIKFIF